MCPNATTASNRPSWAISESYWRGRILYDISGHDFMRLPGVTKKIADDVYCAAEEGWVRGVEPTFERAGVGLALLADLIAAQKLRPQIAVEVRWSEVGTVARRLIDREFTGKAVLHVG